MSVVRIDEVGKTSLDRINKLLAGVPGGIWKATSAAMKRSGETAKTRAGQFAAAEYAISKGSFMHNVSQKTHITGGAGGVLHHQAGAARRRRGGRAQPGSRRCRAV